MVSPRRKFTRRHLLGAGLAVAGSAVLGKVLYEKFKPRQSSNIKLKSRRRNPNAPFKPLTVFGVRHVDTPQNISETLKRLEENKDSFQSLGLQVSQNALKNYKFLYEHKLEKDPTIVGGTLEKGDNYMGSNFFYQIYRWAIKNGKNVEALDSNFGWQWVDDPTKLSIGGPKALRYEKLKKILQKKGMSDAEAKHWIEMPFNEERIASNIKRKDVDAVVVTAWHADDVRDRFPTKSVVFSAAAEGVALSKEHKDAREAYQLRKKKKFEELKKKGFRH